MTDRDVALARLSQLPEVADTPGVDLRESIKVFQSILRDLGDDDSSTWHRVLEERLQRLEQLQVDRRADAIRLLTRLNGLDPYKNPKLLIQYVQLLLDPKGRTRWTSNAEKARHDQEQYRRVAEEELKRDALRSLFFGDVLPKHLPNEENAFVFDFNDPETLRNFDHGFGVLRPAGPRGSTTPRDPTGNLELDLLPGVRGFLRDRPLVLRNPFDPAKRMAIELTLFPQRGPALLVFDLDGVQQAICSMDPSVWKRRFAPDAPTLEDEERLPDFDFYGMGRGVAFHEGPDFGPEFPYGNWDWAAEGQGRNFAKLRDRGYVKSQGGRLFAFDPGRPSYRIRVERWGATMRFFVDGKLILERKKPSWASRGRASPTDPHIRNGSGRLQILTWTPVAIDDLEFIGTPTQRWKEWRQSVMAEAARTKAAEEEASKDAGSKAEGPK